MPMLLSSHNLISRLRRRYAAPAHALFAEVGDATAYRTRSADALVMGLWPSRGLELEGFEIKVDRRDWLRELKDPGKADAICRFCDRWWIVAADKGIVADGELPRTWGLMLPRGDGLVVATEAPKLEPAPMNRHFLAAILRAAGKVNPMEAAVKQVRLDGIEIGRAQVRNEIAGEKDHRDSDHASLLRSIDAFEAASGIRINAWNGGQLGEAVAVCAQLNMSVARRRFENMRDGASQIRDTIDAILASVPEKS